MGNLVRVSGKKIEVRGFGFCTSLNPIKLVGWRQTQQHQTKSVILLSVGLVSDIKIFEKKPQVKCV